MGGSDGGNDLWLSDSEELRALMDAFPDLGFVLDAEGTYREVLSSPESEELLYDDPGWLIGNDLHDVFPPHDAERLLDAIRESIETGDLRTVEYQLDIEAGTRWFEARIHPLGMGHDPPRAVFVARDVTDRKRYQREIERQRGYMQALLESADDIFVVAEPGGRIVDWNEQLLSVTGHTEAALSSMSPTDLFPEGTRETVRSVRDEVLETGRSKAELDVVTRDGERIPHEFVVTLFEDDGECLLAAIGREITERKRREETLRRRTEMLDGVIESLEDVFFVIDETGEIVRYNGVVHDVTGYDREELEGMSATDFFDEDDVEAVVDAIQRGFAEGQSRVEAEVVTESGDRIPYEFVGNAIERYDGKRVLVGIGRDISERREREQQVRVFGRVLRHDIRNKLDIVRGAAERIEGDDDDATDRILEASDELLSTSEKAHEVTELLLRAHAVETVDLGDRVAAAAETCRSQYPAATVTVDREGMARVEAITEVERAFVEVIENGIVHHDGENPRVDVSARTTDDAVVVTVDDDAPPIPEAERAVITGETPITPLEHGSGLGLWLVNWIVNRSGGTLGFDETGAGTVVRVELPRAADHRG